MNKNLLILLLAALMTVSSLTACGGETTETTADTGATETDAVETPVETEPELTEAEKRAAISDDLPEADFEGRTLRVIQTNGECTEVLVEELTGDACNDAIYNRNSRIGERFNVAFAVEDLNATMFYLDATKHIQNAITAGSDEFDLIGEFNFMVYNHIGNGSLMNWMEIPHVNTDKPWHNQLVNDSATINNRLYAICSDMALSTLTYTYAFFFNETAIQDYGYTSDQLYTMVSEGKWTVDQLSKMTEEFYVDKNGDGQKDDGDTYGFGYVLYCPADVWAVAFEQPVTRVNSKGIIEPALMSDKTASIVEKLYALHYNNPGFYRLSDDFDQYTEELYFLNGQFVMAPLRFAAAYTTLRDMDDPYSLLPYPKWDEAQTQYYTNADDKYTAFCVPVTAAGSVDFIGTVYEALCAENYKTVYPVYYDEALKGKYSTNATMAEMVDFIMEGRKFDFSFQVNNVFHDLPYMVRNLLRDGSTDLASRYSAIEQSIQNDIQNKLLPAYGIE